jgi:transcriptional regulator with XRE-family HTH domain
MVGARQALRRRREQQGWTQERLAHALGVETSTYRSWERGDASPRVGRRPRLANLLDVSLAEMNHLLDERDAATVPGSQRVVEWLSMYASFEQGASQLSAFEPVTFHALLQTRDYAAAVERTGIEISDDDVTQRVDIRMARQRVLSRHPEPLELHVVLDESVLHRVTGGHRVMADQLGHVADLAERPNVTVQVLPLDPGVHAAAFGAFTVLTSPGSSSPHMACAIDRTGFRYHELRDAVDAHASLFAHLCHMALPPGTSIDLLRDVAKERYE